jgi:sporulation-control protein spo0M
MQKKGLCTNCVNDKTCTFPRRFPVWQCEEFEECSGYFSESIEQIEVIKSSFTDAVTKEK